MTAEEIVRALAAHYPPVFELGGDTGYYECVLCDSEVVKADRLLKEPARHEPRCPWRRALEWTAEHPA